MSSIDRAFHQSIQKNPAAARGLTDQYTEELLATDCCFGDEAIPSFIKPFFLPAGHYQMLHDVVPTLMNMIEKVIQAYFRYPELHSFFGLPQGADDYMKIDPGFDRTVVIARPDAFWHRGRFQFLEFNCDSPAGSGYADIQQKILCRHFTLKHLSHGYKWKRPHRLQSLLRALLACYRQFAGAGRSPQVAIVDWGHMRTQKEFLITSQYFQSQGIDTVIADPRDLKLRKGKLYHRSFRVDLVYRRVIFNELWEKKKEVRDFMSAYRHHKVCMVNPFQSRLASQKSILAVLTDPEFDFLFSAKERAVRDRYIPWTRRVKHIEMKFQANRASMRKYVRRQRKNWVLKPSDRYGGKGVIIGPEAKPHKWMTQMELAFRDPHNWVVQNFVPVPMTEVPLPKKGRLIWAQKKMNINPFIFNGRLAGAMARLSNESVINVSAGGGLVPAIIYEKK